MHGAASPLNLLFGVAAVCGLVAARYWLAVGSSIDTSEAGGKGPDLRSLGIAAVLTSATLGIASAGYLIGRILAAF